MFSMTRDRCSEGESHVFFAPVIIKPGCFIVMVGKGDDATNSTDAEDNMGTTSPDVRQ
jgi:hypothetical protein